MFYIVPIIIYKTIENSSASKGKFIPFITKPFSADPDTKITCIWLISIVKNLYQADTGLN